MTFVQHWTNSARGCSLDRRAAARGRRVDVLLSDAARRRDAAALPRDVVGGLSGRLIVLDLAKSVGAIMKLAAIVGFFFVSPYVAREIWGFVSAGLYRNERKYVRAFAPASFLLFLLGCVFGYFLLIPTPCLRCRP